MNMLLQASRSFSADHSKNSVTPAYSHLLLYDRAQYPTLRVWVCSDGPTVRSRKLFAPWET